MPRTKKVVWYLRRLSWNPWPYAGSVLDEAGKKSAAAKAYEAAILKQPVSFKSYERGLIWSPKPETSNPIPETRHSKPDTRNPIPENRIPKTETHDQEPAIRNPETRDPKCRPGVSLEKEALGDSILDGYGSSSVPENENPRPETQKPRVCTQTPQRYTLRARFLRSAHFWVRVPDFGCPAP